jgi:MATE family multidrug resistance protein
LRLLSTASGAKPIKNGPDPELKFIRKRIVSLALPVMGENVLHLAFSFVDMIFVGQLGVPQLAGVGLAFQVLLILQSLLAAFSTGTMVLVAHHTGARDEKGAQRVTFQALYLVTGLAAVLGLLGAFYSRNTLSLFGADEEVTMFASDYLTYILVPAAVLVTMFTLTAALRGAGDTKTPLYISTIANLLNIPADYVMIFGHFGFPALGVAGAAIATSVCRAFAVLVLFAIVFSGRAKIRLSQENVPRPEVKEFYRILRVGVPASLEQLMMSLGAAVYASLVLSLGTSAYAAHRIAFNAESISFMPSFGFAIAASSLVGQFRGAGDDTKAERTAFEVLKIAVVFTSVMGAVLLVFPEPLARLFTQDSGVTAMSSQVIRIIAVVQPFLGTGFVMAGALRGAGDTRFPMVSTSLGTWIVRIPVTYFLISFMSAGLVGAWLAMAGDVATRSVLTYAKFRSGSWRMIRLVPTRLANSVAPK